LSSPPSPSPREDERELVERAKYDHGAFGELYDRHFLQIYKFVYSRVRDQAMAEDVTSDVFMKALRSIGRYQDTGRPISAWLYQIAMNAVADRFRAARPTEDIDEQRDLTAGGPGLEQIAAQRDELRRIWAVVETLPTQQLLIHRGVMKVRQSVNHHDLGAGPDTQAWPGVEA